ncbi:Outer membrane protein X precursor [Proteus penneri]|uniref:Outer membrane protein X n=2 Tax=Proteus penneri TaxID=102862 RepID=A0A0G4QGX5_9GAMM|nr:Outer membrane protein X precursor [Proteus penneri]
MCFFLILIIIKFIILMKKILLSLFSSTLLFTSFTYAKSDRPLYSIGYAYIKVKDLPTANGINMRIQALPAANKKISIQLAGTLSNQSLSDNGRLRYVSIALGPAYALTSFIDLYATIGASGISYQPKENINKDNSSKSVSWGTGITFTSPQNITLTLGYEGSYFKMAGKSYPSYALISNIGYRF